MNKEIDNIEVQEVAEEVKKEEKNTSNSNGSKSNPLRSILDGTMLTKELVIKQFPFVIFITILCIFYIANRYSSEKIVRKSQEIQRELKELRAEQISTTSELMQLSQQSEVVKLIYQNELGLIESVDPPKTIIIKNESE